MDNKPTSLIGDGQHDLEVEIANTRQEMSNTVEELHGRLNPAILKDQALEQFHEAAATVKTELKAHLADAKELLKSELADAKDSIKQQVSEQLDHAKTYMRDATIGKVENMVDQAKGRVRSTVDVIKDNPIPAAIAGFGLAWLIMSARKTRRPMQQLQLDEGTSTGTGIRDKASHALSTVKETASAGGHRIVEAAQSAGHAIADATSSAGSAISSVAHRAADGAGAVKTRATDYYQVNPIAFGVAAIAIGTAVGLAIPRTRVENNLMGGVRDDLVDKVVGTARDAAHGVLDKAESAAQQLTSGKTDEFGERPEHQKTNPGTQAPVQPGSPMKPGPNGFGRMG